MKGNVFQMSPERMKETMNGVSILLIVIVLNSPLLTAGTQQNDAVKKDRPVEKQGVFPPFAGVREVKISGSADPESGCSFTGTSGQKIRLRISELEHCLRNGETISLKNAVLTWDLHPFSPDFGSLGLPQETADKQSRWVINSNFNITQTEFRASSIVGPALGFKDVLFKGYFSCSDCVFEGEVDFRNCRFEKPLSFVRTDFKEGINLVMCSFDKAARLVFYGAKFLMDANFRDLELEGELRFGLSSFEKGEGRVFPVRKTHFLGRANFAGLQSVLLEFAKTEFEGPVLFSSSQSRAGEFQNISFSDAVFHEDIGFRHSRVSQLLLFTNVEFGSDLHFRNVEFGTKGHLGLINSGPINRMTFEGVEFNNLTIRGTKQVSSVIFTSFHLPRFLKEDIPEGIPASGLDRSTVFKGEVIFDFPYRNMQLDWNLIKDKIKYDESGLLALEQNYRRQGSEQADEVYYTRWDADPNLSILARIWGFVAGYGVRPLRVLGTCLILVLSFSFVYLHPGAIKNRPAPVTDNNDFVTLREASELTGVRKSLLYSKLKARGHLNSTHSSIARKSKGRWYVSKSLVVQGPSDKRGRTGMTGRVFYYLSYYCQTFLFSVNAFLPVSFVNWSPSDESLKLGRLRISYRTLALIEKFFGAILIPIGVVVLTRQLLR